MTPLPPSLHRHLSSSSSDQAESTTSYIERGGSLAAGPAIESLQRLLPVLHAKIRQLHDAGRLRARLELLATYFAEIRAERRATTTAVREAAFALLYFLKGSDRIPDTVPEVGLLDDAVIVQLVMERHEAVLRAHWQSHGRSWPEGV